MECKARLRGLYRIISSRTISPRLWNAKPACAGENRAPSFRNRRDAASGAHASGAHPGRDAPALQGLPRAQEELQPARAQQSDDGRCRVAALVDRNSFRSPCRARDSGSVQPCPIGSTLLVDRNLFRSPCRARDSGSVQPCPIGSTVVRTAIIRYTPRTVGLKPPAMECEARLPGADYVFKDHSCRSKSASDPGTIFEDRAFICMTTGSSA